MEIKNPFLRAACKASRLGEDSGSTRLLLLPGLVRIEWSQGHLWGLPIAILVLPCPEGPLGLHVGLGVGPRPRAAGESVSEALSSLMGKTSVPASLPKPCFNPL